MEVKDDTTPENDGNSEPPYITGALHSDYATLRRYRAIHERRKALQRSASLR